MRRGMKVALALALAAGMLATSGCIVRRERVEGPGASPVQETQASVPLGPDEEALVRIEMGAGELSVDGDDLSSEQGDDVLRGEFRFSPAELEPLVSSSTDSEDRVSEVEVQQPQVRDLSLLGRNLVNEWDLTLAEGVPTELRVAMGAGNAELDLSTLDLTDLRVEMGAGDLTLDLSGAYTQGFDAQVTAGAGSVKVRLPKDVGVRVAGRKEGVGDWSYDGFTVDGDYLVNDAYGEADATIELEIQRGLGDVVLTLTD